MKNAREVFRGRSSWELVIENQPLFAIATARNRNAGGRDPHTDDRGRKGRIRARLSRTETGIRVTTAISTAQGYRALATRRHVDLNALGNECFDARLRVLSIDVLTVAEKRSARGFALHIAATFEFGVTSNVAIHIDGRRTGARTARVAMVLAAIRRRHVACAATVIGAARVRIGWTIALGMLRHTVTYERLFTFILTTRQAIEFGRVTLRHALRTAGAVHGVGARGASRRGAATCATRNELDGFAFSLAAACRDDVAIREGGVLGDELAALGRHVEREGRRRCEQHGGQSKERKSEFTEVCHVVCPSGLCPRVPAPSTARRTERTRVRELAMDELASQSFIVGRQIV